VPFLFARELRILSEPGKVDAHGQVEAARACLSVAREYERGHHGVITLDQRSRVRRVGGAIMQSAHITAPRLSLAILHGLQRC